MKAREAAERAVQILETFGDEARLAAALSELARTHSNLATVGIIGQPSADAVRYAERALVLGDRLDRDDLRAQAFCYLGSGRLAQGDSRGADDIERAIALGADETRVETRVRMYVQAAGSAYRAGRMQDARRYVAAGLRLAADGEFAAGEYRLQLTSAAVSASTGDWDRAITQLRELMTGPGQAGVMVLLARSMLARLLARRGDPEAGDVLSEAMRDPVWATDSYVAGPLAVAQVEVDWLTGTVDKARAPILRALELAAASGHTAVQAELCGYLRRAGHEVPSPADAPGPWALAFAGRSGEAAGAWEELGERYEQAVELACSEDDHARTAGLAGLKDLGATATIARVLARS
jgi:tetratricopeptide (TPR) repeat protein